MRTVIIAQARMSSTRLPGKTLMDLGGAPVIDHVIARCRRSRRADDLWVATTTDPSDDVLVGHLRQAGVPYVRGSLEDVLSRYDLAADAADADVIVRITCDCPLIDPEVIDHVIGLLAAEPPVDYCSNTLVRTYPIGMDTEVFTRAALARAHDEAVEPLEREHVTPYIYQHPADFRLRNAAAPAEAAWPDLRLTVDEPVDLAMLDELVTAVGRDAGLPEIVGYLKTHSGLARKSAHVRHRHVEKPESW